MLAETLYNSTNRWRSSFSLSGSFFGVWKTSVME
jgi:hypothetical protein